MLLLFTGAMYAQEPKLSKFAPENSNASVMPPSSTSKFQYESVEVGVKYGLPFDYFDYALNFDAKLNFTISEKSLLTADVQYTNFSKKDGVDVTLLPVKFGFKNYLADIFYGTAELGTAIALSNAEGAQLAYGLGAGVRLSNNLDFSLNYENYTGYTGTQLGFRVAYAFK
ncbi:hypothetical protein NBRC110019_19200 [Neptunitalea chrysea]|uniref:Outer membrane protein beta-barrel domain-containing protein n=1 Tax=Neptunitalea chrysea TaxID=1647581 RepID=A0A9W6EU11_9FLAO|nr:hypothetical protein [Neptunitalea chrysea]GLB52880.1 hypothetical protein NBRC110019_19200 [Neptunitalea chrysea]